MAGKLSSDDIEAMAMAVLDKLKELNFTDTLEVLYLASVLQASDTMRTVNREDQLSIVVAVTRLSHCALNTLMDYLPQPED